MDEETRAAIDALYRQGLLVVVVPDDEASTFRDDAPKSAAKEWNTWVDIVHRDHVEPFQGYAGGRSLLEAIRNAAQRLKREG